MNLSKLKQRLEYMYVGETNIQSRRNKFVEREIRKKVVLTIKWLDAHAPAFSMGMNSDFNQIEPILFGERELNAYIARLYPWSRETVSVRRKLLS